MGLMSKWGPSWCHLCRSWFNYLHIDELPIWNYRPLRIGTSSWCFDRWLNWGLSWCWHRCWLDGRCRCGWLRWSCLCLSNWKANLINLTEFILTLKYCSIYSYSYIYMYLKFYQLRQFYQHQIPHSKPHSHERTQPQLKKMHAWLPTRFVTWITASIEVSQNGSSFWEAVLWRVRRQD